jgi:hypothetical protein
MYAFSFGIGNSDSNANRFHHGLSALHSIQSPPPSYSLESSSSCHLVCLCPRRPLCASESAAPPAPSSAFAALPSSSQPPFVNRPSWASSMPPVRDKTKTVGRWQGPTHPRRGGAGGWSGGLGRSSKQRLAAGLAPPLPPSTMSCTTPSSVSCIGASPLLPPSMTCRTVVPLFSLC